jgi:hypothetical protein
MRCGTHYKRRATGLSSGFGHIAAGVSIGSAETFRFATSATGHGL